MSDRDRVGEFDELLERMFAEPIGADEQRLLESHIATDPEALRRYVEAVHLREGLPYLLGEGTAPQGGASADHGERPADEAAPTTSHTAASVVPRMRTKAGHARSADERRLPSWAAAAAIAFAAGAALAAVAYRATAPETLVVARDGTSALHPVTAAPVAPFARDQWLGEITGMSLEASADGILEAMQVGQQLRCGEVVQISSGFVRVALHTGPEFVVEGPAEFSLVSDEVVFLRAGRLAGRGGEQFSVQTPLVTAECRAAAATFVADDDNTASLVVDEGVVSLFTTAQEGVSSERLRALHDGEGVTVEKSPANGRLRMWARGPQTEVVRDWAGVERSLTDYQQLVLADRPVAYWPLHRVRKNRRVLDLTQHGHDGWPIGNWPTELPADEESGAYFSGESYIEPDRKPPINPETGFTVEGWANVEGEKAFQSVFTSRWVLKSHEPDCQMFGFTLYAGEGDRWEFWTGSGRRGELWQRLTSEAPVERRRWTHVVATFTPSGPQTEECVAGSVRLYVDGQLVADAVHDLSLTDFEWPARIGAAEFVPRYLTSWLFRGRLRDIAVYDHPLTDDRVREHHQTGAQAAPLRTSLLTTPGPLLFAAAQGFGGGR